MMDGVTWDAEQEWEHGGVSVAQVICLSEGFAFFSKQSPDSNRLEANMAAMEGAGIAIPLAYQVVFYKEKAADLVRFKQVAELIEFLGQNDSFKGLDGEAAADVLVVVETTIGRCPLDLAQAYLKTVGGEEMVAQVARLAGELASCDCGLGGEVVTDLSEAARALGFGDSGFQERGDAFSNLKDKQSDASYVGVLSSLLGDANVWKAIDAAMANTPGRLQDPMAHRASMFLERVLPSSALSTQVPSVDTCASKPTPTVEKKYFTNCPSDPRAQF